MMLAIKNLMKFTDKINISKHFLKSQTTQEYTMLKNLVTIFSL